MSAAHLSARAGHDRKGDALVVIREAAPTPGAASPGVGVILTITSPVRDLFGEYQDRAVNEALAACGVHDAEVEVSDRHALDWVLRARARAAVLRLRALGGKI